MKFYKSFGVSLRRIIHIIFCVIMMGRDISICISDLCKKMGCVLKLQDKEQAWCPCFKSSCKRVHFSSLMFLVILTGLNTCSWRVCLSFVVLMFSCWTLLPVPYVFVPLSRHLVWLCLMACSKWLSRLSCGSFPKGSQGFTRLLSYLFRRSQLKCEAFKF